MWSRVEKKRWVVEKREVACCFFDASWQRKERERVGKRVVEGRKKEVERGRA